MTMCAPCSAGTVTRMTKDLISTLGPHNRNHCENPILLLRYRGFRVLIRVMTDHVANPDSLVSSDWSRRYAKPFWEAS